MLDKAKLGNRFTCFQCGTKFYDLNRPVPSCPECSADQREAPLRDIKALLASRGNRKLATADDDENEDELVDDEDLADDDDDDIDDDDDDGMLDGDDDE